MLTEGIHNWLDKIDSEADPEGRAEQMATPASFVEPDTKSDSKSNQGQLLNQRRRRLKLTRKD